MFQYDTDWYNASLVAAILLFEDGSDSYIEFLMYGNAVGDGVKYNFNSEKKAQTEHAKAIEAWKGACQ